MALAVRELRNDNRQLQETIQTTQTGVARVELGNLRTLVRAYLIKFFFTVIRFVIVETFRFSKSFTLKISMFDSGFYFTKYKVTIFKSFNISNNILK